MAGAFGFPDFMRRGVAITVNTGAATEGMPAEYLYDPQPGLRARFTPSGGQVTFTVDFGSSRAIGLMALVNTTLAGSETTRFFLNDSDPTFGVGNLLNTVRFPTGVDRTRGQVSCLLAADITARYMRVQITNISAAVLDIGTICAMSTLRLEGGMAFGAMEGRRGLGIADANPFTGAEFRVAGIARPRYVDFSLPSLRSGEYGGTVRDLLGDIDTSTDLAWVPDVDLSQDELHQRVIVGGVIQPGADIGIVRDRPQRGSMRVRLVERV